MVERITLCSGGAYLWKGTMTSSANAAIRPQTVIITAHAHDYPGSAMAQSGTTLPPRLHFFSLDGEVVTDDSMGLRAYATGRRRPVESMLATEASNYALFKFTNTNETSRQRNTNQETYSDIVALVERPLRRTSPDRRSASLALGPAASGDQGARDNLNFYVGRALESDRPADIITISASGLGTVFGGGGVRLSTLLRDLHDTGNDYADVFCVFCRVHDTPSLITRLTIRGRSL